MDLPQHVITSAFRSVRSNLTEDQSDHRWCSRRRPCYIDKMSGHWRKLEQVSRAIYNEALALLLDWTELQTAQSCEDVFAPEVTEQCAHSRRSLIVFWICQFHSHYLIHKLVVLLPFGYRPHSRHFVAFVVDSEPQMLYLSSSFKIQHSL